MAFKPKNQTTQQTTQSAPAQQSTQQQKFIVPVVCTTDSYGNMVGLKRNKETNKVVVLNAKAVADNPNTTKKFIITFAYNDKKGESATNYRDFVIDAEKCRKLRDEAGFDVTDKDNAGSFCQLRFAIKNDGNLPELVNVRVMYKDDDGSYKTTDWMLKYDKKTSPEQTQVEETVVENVEVNDDDLPF